MAAQELAGGFDTNHRLKRCTDDYVYEDDSDLEDIDELEGNKVREETDDEVTGATSRDEVCHV